MSLKLIDVHAHIDRLSIESIKPEVNYDDWLQTILNNAQNSGIKAIIANGTESKNNREVLELAKDHSMIKAALGFYPTDVEQTSEAELDKELEFIKKQKNSIVAIGEVGLDKKYSEHNLTSGKWKELYKKQQEGFEKIITLSEKTKKPLLLHTRKAEQDVIDMLESSTLKNPMLHCFSGKKKLIKKGVDHGWNFSIPVNVIKSQQFQGMIDLVPLAQLLTETDTPYLGLEPGPTNEPANIALSIKKLAEIKKIEVEEMSDQIFLNYMRLFR
jgi:TatD DNase family protein